ncbi:MAG: BMP family ABC transporter substrate-binding protein, partial [Limnochordia bacterium]
MNKKLVVVFSLALVLLMSTAVLAQPIRVALVLSGFLGDQSFNDSAYQGLQRAIEDFGIEVRVL